MKLPKIPAAPADVLVLTVAGVLAAILLISAARVPSTPKPAPAAPAPTPIVCPSEPDDAWIQRRLQYFEERCGPVPYEVKIWKKGDEEGIEGACGRPERLRKHSVK